MARSFTCSRLPTRRQVFPPSRLRKTPRSVPTKTVAAAAGSTTSARDGPGVQARQGTPGLTPVGALEDSGVADAGVDDAGIGRRDGERAGPRRHHPAAGGRPGPPPVGALPDSGQRAEVDDRGPAWVEGERGRPRHGQRGAHAGPGVAAVQAPVDALRRRRRGGRVDGGGHRIDRQGPHVVSAHLVGQARPGGSAVGAAEDAQNVEAGGIDPPGMSGIDRQDVGTRRGKPAPMGPGVTRLEQPGRAAGVDNAGPCSIGGYVEGGDGRPSWARDRISALDRAPGCPGVAADVEPAQGCPQTVLGAAGEIATFRTLRMPRPFSSRLHAVPASVVL